MYEAHFTARADRYTDDDRRAADATAAVLLTGIARLLARPFRRPAPPRLRLVDAPRRRRVPLRGARRPDRLTTGSRA